MTDENNGRIKVHAAVIPRGAQYGVELRTRSADGRLKAYNVGTYETKQEADAQAIKIREILLLLGGKPPVSRS